MRAADIIVNGEYLFVLDDLSMQQEETLYDSPSQDFADKYPYWGNVHGQEVIILSKQGTMIKFFVKGDNPTCWATADSAWFSLKHQNPQVTLPECKCPLWLTGCKCGVFVMEKNPPKPKKREWKYITSNEGPW